jgi:hypothetical protein
MATTSTRGYQTTEFWVNLVAQVLALLSLLGIFNVSSSVGDAIIKLAALIASAGGAAGYAHARAKVKAAPVPNTTTATELQPAVYNYSTASSSEPGGSFRDADHTGVPA